MTCTRALIFCLALAAGVPAALAQDPSRSADDLFRSGDYKAAAAIWSAEAKAGSAEATFHLARLSDLGLGVRRDPERALRGYIAAGRAGHVGAQFNAAAMLDIGLDNPRDVRRAALWYGMAAANGHARSQFALGLLFKRGDGVPRNPDLARYWFGRAAPGLDAAARELTQLGPTAPDARKMAPPKIIGSNSVRTGRRWQVDLVWVARPGPAGSTFLVELVTIPDQRGGGGRTVVSMETAASAVTLDVGHDPARLVWRISRVAGDRSDFAASRWAKVYVKGKRNAQPPPTPKARVTIRLSDRDAPARRFADELSETLSRSGVWTHVEEVDAEPAESGVRYRFAKDAALASGIADYLPVLGAGGARRDMDVTTGPGEVAVTLVGGPGALDGDR